MFSRSRVWPVACIIMAFVLVASLFVASAQPTDPAPKQADAPQPAEARRVVVSGGGVIQPSDNIEATALAIAYHALRQGDAKVTPQAIGQFAAEMMNAMSSARK